MKKIYYIPGIFSIILLPVLGIWYINSHGYFEKISAHDFNYIDFNTIKDWRKKDHIYPAYEFDNRIYKEVYLSNNLNSINTFKYIDQFVNDVVQKKDTINGLKIHFDKNATYNELIEVLNIFNKRNAEIYSLNNNTMYFIGRDWNPNQDVLPFCGTIWENDIVDDREKTFDFIRTFKNIKTQFNQNKIIYSAYIFLFLITIVSIVLKNKKLPK